MALEVDTHTHLHENNIKKPGNQATRPHWPGNIKEAFIGEHNLQPLLAVHKRSINWYVTSFNHACYNG